MQAQTNEPKLRRSDILGEIERVTRLKCGYKKTPEEEKYFDDYLKKLNLALNRRATKKASREANI